jgi:hypothetical protein
MKAYEHKAYDGALAHAARRAWDARLESTSDKGFYPPCFTVYFDGEAMYVRDSKAEKPANAEVVCIAQFFHGSTVQLRFEGARSEWRDF